jgi:hypothetical protein
LENLKSRKENEDIEKTVEVGVGKEENKLKKEKVIAIEGDDYVAVGYCFLFTFFLYFFLYFLFYFIFFLFFFSFFFFFYF